METLNRKETSQKLPIQKKQWKKLIIIVSLGLLLIFLSASHASSVDVLIARGSNFNIEFQHREIPIPDIKNIQPSADASIRSGFPDSNYGTNIYLFIKYYTSSTDKSYIKFSLASIPGNATILSAKIFLYADALYSTHTSNIHFCSNDSWTENGITWNNAPSYDGTEHSRVISSTGWWNWNVKSKVEQEYSGDQVITFVFETGDLNKGADWRSRDYATGTHPYLEITYTYDGSKTESVNESLAFQSDNTLLIEVLSGVLNGTSCSFSLYEKRGSLSFTAMDNSVIEINSPDAEEGFDISIKGASVSNLGNFTYRANIKSGNHVNIVWSWRLESWLDKYTMFALGVSGIGLMVFSPTWVALEFRKKGLDADSIERAGYGVLLFCVGFGLMVMWLWG